jgi:predicted 3-demethylubiquinone-9 3-methyltransferase (glyoxalase superfamily)
VSFELAGQPFMAISAGPLFKFNPSVSFQIRCSSADEVDALWDQLSQGGKVLMPVGSYPFSARYGWMQDKYGLSWQIMDVGASTSAQRVIPMLLFAGDVDGKAEEAINFYVSVFEDAPDRGTMGATRADVLARYGPGEEPNQEGRLQYAQFSIRGQEFAAMDSAGPHEFAFNEAISFLVPCDNQEEIDYLWGRLSADPRAEQCGWLKDKYGVSWQIAPAILSELLGGDDKKRAERATQAFLKMKKFDIAALMRAAAN